MSKRWVKDPTQLEAKDVNLDAALARLLLCIDKQVTRLLGKVSTAPLESSEVAQLEKLGTLIINMQKVQAGIVHDEPKDAPLTPSNVVRMLEAARGGGDKEKK